MIKRGNEKQTERLHLTGGNRFYNDFTNEKIMTLLGKKYFSGLLAVIF